MKKTKLLLLSFILFFGLLFVVGCRKTTATKTQSQPTQDTAQTGEQPTTSQTQQTEKNALSSISVSAPQTLSLTEGDVLTLAMLQGVEVTVNFTKAQAVKYTLSSLTALPEGMTIDKLNTTLEKGALTVSISYTYEGVTKNASFSATVKALLPEGTLEIESVPAGTVELSATVDEKAANMKASLEYGENTLVLTAYVQD